MVTILISAAFRGATLIREGALIRGGGRLLEGGAYFNMDVQKSGAYLRPGAY